MKVRFFDDGRWADNAKPGRPQFIVKANEVVDVSHELAEVVVEAERGEYALDEEDEVEETEEETGEEEEAPSAVDRLLGKGKKKGKKKGRRRERGAGPQAKDEVLS